MERILSWFWPPLAFEIRKRKFLAWERKQYAKWIIDVWIPSQERDSARLIREFREPMLFSKFL